MSIEEHEEKELAMALNKSVDDMEEKSNAITTQDFAIHDYDAQGKQEQALSLQKYDINLPINQNENL